MSNTRQPGGLLLAIDTSGPLCAAGLFEISHVEGVERSRAVRDIGRGHAEHVIDTCEDALREAEATWADLGRVAVTVGPGSFTGIRAGVAAARGLALSLGLRAVGVTTLEAMRGPRPAAPYLVALDARRGQIYAQSFDADGTATGEPMLDTPAAIAARVPSDVRLVVGSGASSLVDAVRAGAGEASVATQDGRAMIDAQPDVANVAARALAASYARPPAPFYMRGADAKLPGGVDPAATTAPPSRAT